MEAAYSTRKPSKKAPRRALATTHQTIPVLPDQAGAPAGLPRFLEQAVRAAYPRPASDQPGDLREQEADQVASQAAQVVTAASSLPQAAPGQPADATGGAPIAAHSQGTPLPVPIRTVVELLTGVSLSQVRVHQDQDAQETASLLRARAFTHGNHIWLSQRQNPADVALLAHEATHAAQQIRWDAPTRSASQTAIATRGQPPVVQRQEDPAPQAVLEPPASTVTPSSSDPLSPVGAGEMAMEDLDTAIVETNQLSTGEVVSEAEVAAQETSVASQDAGEAEAAAAAGATEEEVEGLEGAAEAEEEGEAETGGAGAVAAAGDQVEGSGAGELATGDLALIDEELAEHQRWAGAQGRVGAASSEQRASFVAEMVGSGFLGGLGTGGAMGLGAGLAGRAATYGAARAVARWGPRIGASAARFTPVPAVGAIIGGAMSVYGLATRDWSTTGATISRFGEGSSTYETLANSIAAISEIIDIVSNILNVVAGILGIISAAMWVAAVLSAGALSPLAGTLTSIALGISAATTILDAVNSIILQPSVVLFRALHTFTAEADPREVEANGTELSQAAAASGGALGGFAGGKVAGARPRGRRPAPPTPDTPNPRATGLPPAAAGDGPAVTVQRPPASAAEVPSHTAAPASRPAEAPATPPAPTPAAPSATSPSGRTATTAGTPSAPAATPRTAPETPATRPATAAEPPAAPAPAPAPTRPNAATVAATPPATAPAGTPSTAAPAGTPAAAASSTPTATGGGPSGGGPTGGGTPPGGRPPGGGGNEPLFPGLTDAEIDAAFAQAQAGPLVQAPAPTGFRTGTGQGGYWGVEPATGMTVQEYRFPARRGTPPLDPAGNPLPGPRGDVQTRMRIHSPDPTAPPGSPAREGWTVGFEQGNARMTGEGQWFDTRYQTPSGGGSRIDVRPYRRAPDGSWVHAATGAPVTDAATVSALNQWDANMAASHIPLTPQPPATPPAGGSGGTPPTTPPAPTPAPGTAPPAPSTTPGTTPPATTPPSARPPRPGPDYNWVPGYTRSDGRAVRGHWRRTGGGSSTTPTAPTTSSNAASTVTPGQATPTVPSTPPAGGSGGGVTPGSGSTPLFIPHTPVLHGNWPYNTPVPNRASLGHNVQRDHVIAQAKLRDILGDDYIPSVRDSLTVLAETGAISAASARPHTQATFRDPQADVPEINRLRQQGGPHSFADMIDDSRQARLRSGYQDRQAIDRAWVDQMGRAFEIRRMGEARVDAEGNPILDNQGHPMESVADRLARFQRESGEEVTPIPDVDTMDWSDFDVGPSTPASAPTSPGPGGSSPPPVPATLAVPSTATARVPAAPPVTPTVSSTPPAMPAALPVPVSAPAVAGPPTPLAAPPTSSVASAPSVPTPRPAAPAPAMPPPAPQATSAARPETPSTVPPPGPATAPGESAAPRVPLSVLSQAAQEAAAPPTIPVAEAAPASGPGPAASAGTAAPQVPQQSRLPRVAPAPPATPYEQQQEAQRARFTPDNQPETGVVRVNPNYPSPPGTPEELSAMQEEIASLLSQRAQAEQAEADMASAVQTHQANQAPIQQTVEETAGGISAVQAHQEAVARREQANQEQQQRQQESQSLVAGYPSRATGLSTLKLPLRAFQGLTHLASYLPGRAGRAMDEMNQDATRMLEAFDQMDASMAEQNEAQPARQQELQGDAQRLGQTDEQAGASLEEMTTGNAGAIGLQEANDQTLQSAQGARDEAAQQGGQMDQEIAEREASAQTLAEQLQAWAVQHQAARQQAIEETRQRAVDQGLVVVETRER